MDDKQQDDTIEQRGGTPVPRVLPTRPSEPETGVDEVVERGKTPIAILPPADDASGGDDDG